MQTIYLIERLDFIKYILTKVVGYGFPNSAQAGYLSVPNKTSKTLIDLANDTFKDVISKRSFKLKHLFLVLLNHPKF